MNIFNGENKYVEYKREFTKNTLKTICAFANFHDGYIVFGVDDDGNPTPILNIDETKLIIENSINDNIIPLPFYEFEIKEYQGIKVIILKIFRGEFTPYTINNKAYIRSDTSTIQANRDVYSDLVLLGRNMGYEDLYTLDEALNFTILENKLKTTLGIGSISKDLLRTLELIKNDKYTNAASLLADESGALTGVDLICYENNGVKRIKDRQISYNNSIIKQYDDCMDFYKKHINRREYIEGAYRETVEEVPFIAYREAIANMILHRDYSKKINSRVEIFDDRIEITSPGSLPYGISSEEYIDGRISMPRNKIIASVFLKLGIIEKLATGIRRIKEYYSPYDRKPKFLILENSITVILPKVDKKNHEELDLFNLNGRVKEVYEYIYKNPNSKRTEIENLIGLKKTQTIELIDELRQRGYIIKLGNGPSTTYKVNLKTFR
jgi:ATP-dependent DNA helicase RecG